MYFYLPTDLKIIIIAIERVCTDLHVSGRDQVKARVRYRAMSFMLTTIMVGCDSRFDGSYAN